MCVVGWGSSCEQNVIINLESRANVVRLLIFIVNCNSENAFVFVQYWYFIAV
jgi:hypothetical protein